MQLLLHWIDTHTTNIKTLPKTLPTSVSTHHLHLSSVITLVSVPNESQLHLPLNNEAIEHFRAANKQKKMPFLDF